MAEHELKLKATIDTSQVQQQLGQLGSGAGSGVQINTQKLDQAFSKLAQSLNKFQQTVDQMSSKLSRSSGKISGMAVGSVGSVGGIVPTMLKGASIHFVGQTVQNLASSGARFAEAKGYKDTAKTLNTTSQSVAKVAGGTLSGAAAGALIGTGVPVLGTAVGAGIGAAVGLATSALEYFADKAKEAAETLEKIANFKKGMENIVENVDQRNAMKIATGGPSEAREQLYVKASANLKEAEDETNRLRDIAKHNAEVLKSKTELNDKERESLQKIVDQYKEAAKKLQNNQQIVDAINNAKKQEAEKARQEAEKKAAEEKRKADWNHSQSISNKKAQDVLAGEQEIKEYESKSTEELTALQEELSKDIEDSASNIAELLEKRKEAIEKGDEELAKSILEQIQAVETSTSISEKKTNAIKSILDKRNAIEGDKSKFEQNFNRKEGMEEFSKSIKKTSIGSLKQMLHDLNIQKMYQRDKVLQANESGDFKTRDEINSNLQDTEAKMKMVQAQIDKLQANSGNIWEGAGQMSEMARVGMYVSNSDQGLNDPKLQAQREGNELLRQIKDNTANQVGGLE